jgi:hypothetical protein
MRAALTGTIAHGIAVVAGMGWDRLVLACFVVAAVVVLAVTDKIDAQAVIGILSAIVGYVVGAGHEAAKTERNGGTK